jgi:Domain of unknown function (DUF4407)
VFSWLAAPYRLARLAGANGDVLARARTDRAKYSAMGGVLLTTAGMAGVSAAFALHSSVRLPLGASIVAGVLWAIVIFNLDRMLIVSITRQSGWARNLLAAIPRLALALVIGAVVSVPLVLRIFEKEIHNEMQLMHTENLTEAQQKLDKQYADIPTMRAKVDELNAIVSGASQPNVSDEEDVKAAQGRVNAAQAAYDTAAARAQCELDGTCGTRRPGVGTAYEEAAAKAAEARRTLEAETAKLNEVTAAAERKISGSATKNRAAAQRELRTLEPRLAARSAERDDAQRRLDSGELESEGMLAQLEALDRLTDGHPNMQAANLALTALFLLVEVLPVVVKLLTLTGKPSLYERMLDSDENALEKIATKTNKTALDNADDLRSQQLQRGKDANALLAEQQFEIAKKAIETWGRIAKSRTDDELARWYAKHAGEPEQPSQDQQQNQQQTQQPMHVPGSITVPLMTPVAQPLPGPRSGPDPATGRLSYQEFKATVGPPPNGRPPTGPDAHH